MVLSEIELIFIVVVALFFVLLTAKGKISKRFCVICTSVSLTWIGTLILYRLGYFSNILILGILMGESITGIYYLAEKNVVESLHVFRLPFLLTLTLAAYILLDASIITMPLIVFFLVLWLLFLSGYIYRHQESTGRLIKKIIECCKNW
jgi:hypothetical protein